MNENKPTSEKLKIPLWAGVVITILFAGIVLLLGLLAISVMERRWETARPSLVLKPIAQWEPNNAVWGQNYPLEYEAYLKTANSDTRTKYGGSFQRDYLEENPGLILLFAGSAFSKDYVQARGHYHALEDVLKTKRLKYPYNPGTCITCKSTDVPRLMDKMGVKEFYASNFHDLKKEVKHPLGCQDCHDPATMNLRITRPALKEAFESMGSDINKAAHQQMRSLVCAQCHVEYYHKPEPKEYLTFPWKKGKTVEDMIAYYDEINFTDYTHAISGTPMIKAQHPDYEIYSTGIHAYQDISCADCHMPYRTEGGLKFTDHHIQSPLLNISNSCVVCHRWSEDQLRQRVETIQDKVRAASLQAENALIKAHFDVAAAVKAGVTDDDLASARKILRHAQFRWDYVSAGNGMGFHSPQECMRILGQSADQAQQTRLLISRLLAKIGITEEPAYPDYSTKQNAQNILSAFK